MDAAPSQHHDDWSAPRTLLAWVVASVFVLAAVEKIYNPADFAQSIKYYKLLPGWAVNGLALLLPWWELGAAVALLAPAWRRAGAWMVWVMLWVFIAAVGSAMARGLDISCGCFGKASGKAGLKALALDVGLLAATWAVLLYRVRSTAAGATAPLAPSGAVCLPAQS